MSQSQASSRKSSEASYCSSVSAKSSHRPSSTQALQVFRIPEKCPRVLRLVYPDARFVSSGFHSLWYWLSLKDNGDVVALTDYGSPESSRVVNETMSKTPARCLRSAIAVDDPSVLCAEPIKGPAARFAVVETPKNVVHIPAARLKRLEVVDTADAEKIDIKRVLESLDGKLYYIYRLGERDWGRNYRTQRRQVRILTESESKHLAGTLAQLRSGETIVYNPPFTQCYFIPEDCPRLLATVVLKNPDNWGSPFPTYYWLNTTDDGTVTFLSLSGGGTAHVQRDFAQYRATNYVRELDQPNERYVHLTGEVNNLHIVPPPAYACEVSQEKLDGHSELFAWHRALMGPIRLSNILRALDGRHYIVMQRSKSGAIQRVRPMTSSEVALLPRLVRGKAEREGIQADLVKPKLAAPHPAEIKRRRGFHLPVRALHLPKSALHLPRKGVHLPRS